MIFRQPVSWLMLQEIIVLADYGLDNGSKLIITV